MYQINQAAILSKELLEEFNKTAGNHKLRLDCSFPKEGREESFCVSSSRGTVHIDAVSPLAAAYGISQAIAGIKSGFIGELIGNSAPRLPLRPIWIAAGGEVEISSGISVVLPAFIFTSLQQGTQRDLAGASFCRRLIELGYNAVVLGVRESAQVSSQKGSIDDVVEFMALLHAYGLKVIVKPMFSASSNLKQGRCCPVNSAYRKWISSCFQTLCQKIHIDYLFWEGNFLHKDFTKDSAAKDMTLLELVAAEIDLLEQSLPLKTSLIYYLTANDPALAKQQAVWMTSLCDEVGERTILAFPAVAGDSFEDHLPPHPFWEQLRASPDVSSTRLMPVLNSGMVMQGEGLWPSPALDLVEKYYSRLCRHSFAGVLMLSNMLPQQGSILDCSLWVAGQGLWRSSSSALLAEMWFRAFRTEWNFLEIEGILNGARQIAVELSMFRSLTQEARRDSVLSEDCRITTESVLSRLKELVLRAERLERKRLKRTLTPSILDYMQVFSRDAQRIILHFLQCFNLSFPHVLGPEEMTESFWMHLSPGGGQGIRSSAKVTFAAEPRSGPVGSRMEEIFRENRFI